MERRFERIVTEDGSHTYRDRERDITFRSTHGATTESRYVFVEGCGLRRRAERAESWRVLELGFGGARNFGESVLVARELDVTLRYRAVERSPLPLGLLEHDDPEVTRIAREALANPGEAVAGDGVDLAVYRADWRDAPAIGGGPFDAIYHDPFAPSDDPESWTRECFEWSATHVHPGTILATYSAATAVRKAMAEAGWWVASAPGPGRKREVTFASPTRDMLSDWEIVREPQ
jgi:tRNA U34 5-methylaminomethyl-2-thiouridine-forming methyltransferase MnmC